jgi:tetratricopeptide (TPR) repeat protein
VKKHFEALAAVVIASLVLTMGGVWAGPRQVKAVEPVRVEQDFVAANELALKGDLKAAIDLYRTLVDQGVDHEDLLYNLGNAYAQDGQLVQAIVSYERALRLAPNDRDVKANLETIRKKLAPREKQEKILAEDKVAFADVVEPMVAPLSLPVATHVALAADVLLFLFLLLRRRSLDDRSRRRFGLVALASLFALSLASSVIAGHAIVAHDPRAVILEPSDLKEGPNARFGSAGRIGAGQRVRVIDQDGAWVRILRQDGTSGWIDSKAITDV